MKQNMHIHSKYSFDSKMEIGEIANILYKNGIQYGAITDHIEFDKESMTFILAKFKLRNLEINRINEKYEGKLTLLKAAEISEPHLHIDKIRRLEILGLDFIIGSIHKIDKTAINLSHLEKTKIYRMYYKEVLKMVESEQVDVIGHLDYINKYYDRDYQDVKQIHEIHEAIKEHKQIIEINTSAERRIGANTFPSLEKICGYKLGGQTEITIGTDAHRYNELTDNLAQSEIIKEELGLQPVIYQKRKRIII